MQSPPRHTSGGISSTPPTPTEPMKNPTRTAMAASASTEVSSAPNLALSGGERDQFAGEQRRERLHERVADRMVALHQLEQPRAADRDNLAGGEAVRGRDALRVPLDQRGPAEHVAAPDDLARRSLALAQAEGEAHGAVGEHVEVLDRVADEVDRGVLREGLERGELGDAGTLGGREAREEARLVENADAGVGRRARSGRQADAPRREPAGQSFFQPTVSLNFFSSSSFMNTVCSGPG